jgi:integrase
MPRKLEKALTPRKVQTAGPGLWADGGCLYLQVTESRKSGELNKSWVFRYGVPGPNGRSRFRDHGMGSLSTWTLAQARKRAQVLRQKRDDGIDPIEERKAARAVVPVRFMTFDEVADQWLDAKALEWKPTYRRAQRARLRDHASPIVGKLAVRAISVEHVTAILDPIWLSHPNSASLLRMQIEQILDFAKIKGHREGENPARWVNLKHVYGKTAKLRMAKRTAGGKGVHHAALSYKLIAAFMAELHALPERVDAWALEFTILTAARTGEVVGAMWNEIDLDARTWTIPAGRMKAGKEHRVPLSDPAVAILKRVAEIQVDGRVFPGLASRGMFRLLQQNHAALTVHGFRSSFRDWAGEETNFAREIAEAALAHYAGGTEGAYARGDLFKKRRLLMDAWASYCARPAVDAKVLPMKAVRS